jgi:hypothetical protein
MANDEKWPKFVTVFGAKAHALEALGELHGYVCVEPWVQLWRDGGFWYASSRDVAPLDPRASAQDACELLELETRRQVEQWGPLVGWAPKEKSDGE